MGFLKKIKQYGLLSGLIFCSSSCTGNNFDKMASKMTSKFEVPTISVEHLKKEITENKIHLLDARERSEFNVSHISSAKYVGFDDFDINLATKDLPLGAKVVVYCSVGYRSGKIAEKLKKKGYDVYNLKGGIFDWVNKSNPVVNTAGKSTSNIHGYDKSWAKWLKKGNVVNGN